MFLNIDGEDIPVKDFKVNLSKTDDDDVSFNKPDDTVEMRMENELTPEQKDFFKEFLKACDEYMEHKKSHTINGWYVHDCHDDLRYLHDTGYYAEHISTGQEISLGSEYDGLMNSLRFIEAITGQECSTNVNDCCYNCSYYLTDDYFERNNTFLRHAHGCRCYWILQEASYIMEIPCDTGDMHLNDVKKLELEENHLLRKACEFHYTRTQPLPVTDYTVYDELNNRWHELNSVNDWSLFTARDIKDYRPGPSSDDVYLARHIPTGNLIYMGLNENGYKNSVKLYHALIGQSKIQGTSCTSCTYYPNETHEDICLKNHLMPIQSCNDYTKKERE